MSNVINGTANDDTLHGVYEQENTITGGLGNDTIFGSTSADTYVFSRGDGQDLIYEGATYDRTIQDRIKFGPNISLADIRVVYQANNRMNIQLFENGVATEDQIGIVDASLVDGRYRVELLEFDDGSTVELDSLPYEYHGTDLAEDITAATQHFNEFYAGKGDDNLAGSYEEDHYYFNRGDGKDFIIDPSGQDKVIFGEGILPSELVMSGNGDTLIITIKDADDDIGDQITIHDALGNDNYVIEEFVFSNGVVRGIDSLLTTPFLYQGTEGSDVIYGGTGQENMFWGEGGRDNLYGSTESDTFFGGEGKDSLRGYGGADYYYYNRGDGKDTIWEDGRNDGFGVNDILVLGAGIGIDDIHLSTLGNYLVIEIWENGQATSDQVKLYNGMVSDDYLIETVQFSGGNYSFSSLMDTLL